jgi:hypothetical protein
MAKPAFTPSSPTGRRQEDWIHRDQLMDLARALTDPTKRRQGRMQPGFSQDGAGSVFVDPYQGYPDADTFRMANDLGGRGWQVGYGRSTLCR